MPCYEVNTISVDLRVADKDTLHAALAALGLEFTQYGDTLVVSTKDGPISITGGKATFDNEECQGTLNKIKQMYSVKTVERIAKKYKFNVVGKGNKLVLRRY